MEYVQEYDGVGYWYNNQ